MVKEVKMSDEHEGLSPARPRHDLVRDPDAHPERRRVFGDTELKRQIGCEITMRDWRRLRGRLAREKKTVADFLRELIDQAIADEPDPAGE